MGGVVVVLIILAIVAFLGWQFAEGKRALATTQVESRYTPEETAQIVDGAFGGARSVLWANTSGPGTINKRRRGYRGGITMSIDIEPSPDGGSRVNMWASEHLEYLVFLVNFAGVVNRRKRAIARLLAEPNSLRSARGAGDQPVSGHRAR